MQQSLILQLSCINNFVDLELLVLLLLKKFTAVEFGGSVAGGFFLRLPPCPWESCLVFEPLCPHHLLPPLHLVVVVEGPPLRLVVVVEGPPCQSPLDLEKIKDTVP